MILNRPDAVDLAWRSSLVVSNLHLALLARADARGRSAGDIAAILERIDLFVELCREQRCWEGPRRFASPHTRWLWGLGRWRDPDVPDRWTPNIGQCAKVAPILKRAGEEQ